MLGGKVVIAAVGDIHCARSGQGLSDTLFSKAAECADVLLLCGDITDYGHPEEAMVVIKEFTKHRSIPVIGVLGNHDYEAGKPEEVRKILTDGGIRILDGDTFEFRGVGFVGVKGFGGGFRTRMLEPWGESMIKAFVREGVNESLKLETGLARLTTQQKIVLLHYAPIQDTVEGEPCETFPFLGSSRLEEPINRYNATAVFHGHAHHGFPEGRTREGVPVYNVAAALLKKNYPDWPPFRLFELSVVQEQQSNPTGSMTLISEQTAPRPAR